MPSMMPLLLTNPFGPSAQAKLLHQSRHRRCTPSSVRWLRNTMTKPPPTTFASFMAVVVMPRMPRNCSRSPTWMAASSVAHHSKRKTLSPSATKPRISVKNEDLWIHLYGTFIRHSAWYADYNVGWNRVRLLYGWRYDP